MEEMGDNARVWRVYNDEADRIDAEMVDGWRSTLDTLFIFAGLFSAVVATFVTQTTQNLQPNYSEVTASLLTELVSIQRTAATNGNISTVNPSSMTHDTPFTPARRDIVLNGLWFVSLVLTLTTALISGLVRQWLHFYIADTSGTAKERACTRQLRFAGLATWGVSPIIEILPVLMNISLLLFFAGLILFCEELSGTEGITAIIIALTCISFVFYLGSSILSLLYPHCPYKSSLSTMFNLFFRIIWHLFIRFFVEPENVRVIEQVPGLIEDEDFPHAIKVWYKLSSMRGAESTVVSHQQWPLQVQVITAMVTNFSNSTVPEIALQALAGLHKYVYTFSDEESPLSNLWFGIADQLDDWFPRGSNLKGNYQLPVTPSVAERYCRALLCSPFNLFEAAGLGSISMFLAQSDPENLRYLGLRALLVQRTKSFGKSRADSDRDALIQYLHQLPPIEIHEVHPWIWAKLRQIMLFGRPAHQDEASIFSHLAQNLSPLKPPTLQEDLMLYHLELTYAPPGFFNKEEIQMQSGTQAEKVDLAKGLGHIGFSYILPSLARVGLSTGVAEHGDGILGLMNEMFKTAKADAMYPSWNPSPWDASLRPSDLADSVRAAPFKPVLEQLLDILVATEEPKTGQLWKGSIPLRLSVIMRLHNTIYDRNQYHRPTLDAIFYWLLHLSTYERSDGVLPLIYGIDQKLESDLNSFFMAQFSKQSSHPLVGLCDYLAGHTVLGLPKTMLEHLVETVDHPRLGPPNEWIDQTILEGLDRLFGYFVRRNLSNIDQHLASTEEEQQNTLVTIVELACKGKPATTRPALFQPWNAMLTSWLASLREASANRTADHLEAATIKQENEDHSQATLPGLDFAALTRLVEQAIETSPKERTSISSSRTDSEAKK